MEPPQILSILSTTILTPEEAFQYLSKFLQKQKSLLQTTPLNSQEENEPTSDEEQEEEDPIKRQVDRLFEEDDVVGNFQEVSERLKAILSSLPGGADGGDANVVVDTFVPSPKKDTQEVQTQYSREETSAEDESIESESNQAKQEENLDTESRNEQKAMEKESKKAEKAKRKAIEKAEKKERKAKEKAEKKAAKKAIKEEDKRVKKQEKKRRKSMEGPGGSSKRVKIEV
jgi:hypothetical protein